MIKQFHKPSSIEEALAIKETHGDTITWFSGGAYLNHIDQKGTFEQVICLEQLQLNAIEVSNRNLKIGSSACLQDIMDHEATPHALAQAIRDTAPRTFRNLATIGGDIAMGGMITRLTPCLIALNAKLVVNQRDIPVDEYSNQNRSDLIIKLLIPINDRTCKTLKVSHQANADPLCTVAVSMDRSMDNRISNPKIAIGSIESHCRRLTGLEETLQSGKIKDFQSIQSIVSEQVETQTDFQGSAEYKSYITGQAVAECVISCLEGGA